MKYLVLLSLLFFPLFPLFSQNSSLSVGTWKIKLEVNDTVQIPFFLEIDKDKANNFIFSILNGEEAIKIVNHQITSDSLFLELPVFNSFIKVKLLDEYNFKGAWYNFAKGPNYSIPLTAYKTNENRFEINTTESKTLNFSGKYEVLFSTENEPFAAIGLFEQKKEKITGTFLTETGDFRFLEGNVYGNKLYLSCFDGSHAFLFTGSLVNDTIHGNFYSGMHYVTNWVGIKNNQYNLADPDSITKSINQSDIKFSLLDLDSVIFNFPNEKYTNRVTIIQIMGSWCPNCMDETSFYNELYENYNEQGLEIIAVAFETPKDFQSKARMLKKLKNHFNLHYQLLIGGDADKQIALEIFPNLNSIVSFPTSIFIDKNNKIRRIHTGFNGPGTNKHYKNYVKETKTFIEDLLAE